MERKLNHHELSLWKEVTKDDRKMKDYLTEEKIENKAESIKKKDKIKKNYEDVNETSSGKIKDKGLINKQKPQINKRMRTKFERGLIRPEANLDLHGYNRIEAEKTLEAFIKTCIYKEKRCILVVTGKKKSILGSKSVLRELVPKWLNEKNYSSLVLAHSYATQKDGGDGARYILLRKKENNDE